MNTKINHLFLVVAYLSFIIIHDVFNGFFNTFAVITDEDVGNLFGVIIASPNNIGKSFPFHRIVHMYTIARTETE